MTAPIYVVKTTAPIYYRREIDSSEPGHGHLDIFRVKVDNDAKKLICSHTVWYTLWESVAQTPFKEKPPMTNMQCEEMCFADKKCKEFVRGYLEDGFKFQSSN